MEKWKLKREAGHSSTTDPVYIIGLGVRIPGKVDPIVEGSRIRPHGLGNNSPSQSRCMKLYKSRLPALSCVASMAEGKTWVSKRADPHMKRVMRKQSGNPTDQLRICLTRSNPRTGMAPSRKPATVSFS